MADKPVHDVGVNGLGGFGHVNVHVEELSEVEVAGVDVEAEHAVSCDGNTRTVYNH